MKKWEYKVTNSQGLHARPAGLLVREARKYVSRVLLESGGKLDENRRQAGL